MIILKSSEELALMMKTGAIVRDCLALAQDKVREGMTTAKLDRIIYDYITSQNAYPSFLGYMGFPGSACISVNEEVVHGIPGKRIIKEGDIVSVDVGAKLNGFHADAARTFAIGKISAEKDKLIRVCKESFFKGVEKFTEGGRLGDISSAIQEHAESNGFSVVRELVGHGIGRDLHEDPNVPNYGIAGHGIRLKAGMVFAIEPMICAGKHRIYQEDNGWTIVTADGKPSAHYENTVALTENGIVFTTL